MGVDQVGGQVGGHVSGTLIAVATPDAAPKAPEMQALVAAGLTAVPVDDVASLSTVVAQLRPDLVLLKIAGHPTPLVDVLTELTTVGTQGVVVCGQLPDPAIRAALLYAGADDCLLAPYLLEELVARVLAVLRRTQAAGQAADHGRKYLVPTSIRVDVDHHSVTVDGEPVALTLIEFRLLLYLLRNRGVALTRPRLLADVWGYTIGTSETVTVHIQRLRSKIERDPSRPMWIETVWGVGYRFSGEPNERSAEAELSSGTVVACP